jgi:hypothetical protein
MLKKGDKMITYWEVSEVNKEMYNYWNKLFGTAPYKLTHQINNVIFNPPATIVFWSDGTKTIAKCEPCDKFDKEKGLMMAILKKEHKASDIIDVFDKYIYTKEDK